MGEKVQIGPMTYSVLESEWKTALTEGGRAPKNRFLFLRITMTNSGGQPAAAPSFELEAADGTRYQELTQNVEGVNNWLGLLRNVPPSSSQQGAIIFDAPIAAYKLVIPESGDITQEKYALVEIPVHLE